MSIRNDFASDNNSYYSAPPGGWGAGDYEEDNNNNDNDETIEQQKNSQNEEQLPRNDFAPVRWVNSSQESQPSSSQQQQQQQQQEPQPQQQEPQEPSQDDNRLFLQEQELERQKLQQQQADEKKRKQAADEEQEMQRLISLIAQEEESRKKQQEEDQRRAEEEEKRRQRQEQDEEDEMQNRRHQYRQDDEEYYESVERDILHQDNEKEARISATQQDEGTRKKQQEIDAFDEMQRQKKLRREQEKDYERRKMQFKLQQLVDLEFANIEESEARRRFVAGQDEDFARLLLSEFEQRHAEENKLVYTGYLDEAIFSEDDQANNFFDQFSCHDDEEDESDFEIRRALFVEHALDLKKTEQQLKFQALMSLQIQSSRTMLWFTSLAVKLKTEWLEREARWVLMTGFHAMKLRIKKRKHFSHNITKVQREFVEAEERRKAAAKTQAEVRAVQSGVLNKEPRTLAAALQVILVAHETRHEIMKLEKQAREKIHSEFKASHYASTMHDLDREQLIVQAARQQRKKRWEQMDPFLVRRRMPVVASAGMVFVPAPPGSRGVSVSNNFCGRSSAARANTSDSANGRHPQTQRDLFPQISNKQNNNNNNNNRIQSNNPNLASSTNSRPQTSGSPAVVRNLPEGYRYANGDDEDDDEDGNAHRNRQLILRRQQQQKQQREEEEQQRYNGNNIGASERAIVDQENYVPPSRVSKSQQKDKSYARGFAGGYDQQWYPYPPGTEKSRIQPNQKTSLSPSRSNTNNNNEDRYSHDEEESNSYQRGSQLGNQQNDENTNQYYYSTSTTTTAPGTKKLVRKSPPSPQQHQHEDGDYSNYNLQQQRPNSGSMNSHQSSSQNLVMNSGGNSHRSSNNNNNFTNYTNSRANSVTSSRRPGTSQSQQLY